MVEVIRRLSLLNEAARAMTSLMAPDKLLDRILDLTAEVFDFDACAILLTEPNTGELVIRRARGYDPEVVESFRGRPGEGVTGRALAEKQVVVVSDVAADNGYVPGVRGAVAEVAAPMIQEGNVIGILDAESRKPLEFTKEDVALLSSFASHAATVVQNAQLHHDLAARSAELDRRFEHQRLLARAAEAMLSTLSPAEVLAEILGLAEQALAFESCAVCLLDESREHLRVHAAHGGYRDDWRELRIPVAGTITGEVIETGLPVLVPDVTQDPRYIEGVAGSRCEMAVPLAVRGEVIGVLDAEATTVGAFTDEDLEIFSIFAHQAAVALRNAQLHERVARHRTTLEHQLHRQRLLAQSSDLMLSTLSCDDVLTEIMSLAQQALAFETCAVLLLDEAKNRLTMRAAHGYRNDWRELVIPVGQGVTGRVVSTGKPLLVPDVTQEPSYIAGVSGGRCEMAVPLIVRGRVIGVLDAEATEPGAFTEEDLETFAIFGGQAAVALRNAGLLERLAANRESLQRQLNRQRLLAKSSDAMLSTLSCDEVLGEIMDLAKQALGFETSAVLMLDEDGEHLVFRSAHGYRKDWREVKIPVGQGITGHVVRTGQPELVPDVNQDPRYIPGISGGQCEMTVPLAIRGRIIGVLDAEARDPGAFTEEDLETFAIFSGQAAVALRNAGLLERLEESRASLEQQLRRQRLVRRAGETVRSTLEQEALLRKILEIAREGLQFTSCAVLLLDKQAEELRLFAALGYGRDVSHVVVPAGQGITGAALTQGRPVLVADVTKDSRYIPGMAGGRCELAVPLIVDGEVIGVLDAEADEVNAFDEEDVDLFEIFASDVAVAIRNARQFSQLERANARLKKYVAEIERMNAELSTYAEEISRTNSDLERRVRELATIYEASQTITSSLDLQDTLQTIAQMTRVIINASSSAIRLLDEESEELRANETGTPDSMADALTRAAEEQTPGTQLQTPLRIGDRTIGFFELGRDEGEFTDEEKRMLRTLASQAAIAIENSRLFERTQRTYYETIRALAQALEARDAYTRGHSERVTRYALHIARAMEIPEEEQRIIEHAGLLHDIGKIGISDTILQKTSQLSAEDRKVIEHHPLFGDTILGPLKFLNRVQDVVKHHHERFDGHGYPDGLKADEIPLSARIVGVADAYDAMTSDRPYRPALSRDEAIQELISHRGHQFDPQVVDCFVEILHTRYAEQNEVESDGAGRPGDSGE